MSETGIILDFIRSCTRGNFGFSECSPVFAFGGIALATVILGLTLAALMMRHPRMQPDVKSGQR